MATRDGGLWAWLRGELAADWTAYREGATGRRTVRALVEPLLGLALLVRLGVHVYAYSALADADHPLDVQYGLSLASPVVGVRARPLVAAMQVGCATTAVACLLALDAMRYDLSGGLGVLVVANWLFLVGDPLWLAWARQRANN
jgi:hypothetical protein